MLTVRPWLPMALLAVMPGLSLNQVRKARRVARQGLCPKCGYDLRATPKRCPECGTAAIGGETSVWTVACFGRRRDRDISIDCARSRAPARLARRHAQ